MGVWDSDVTVVIKVPGAQVLILSSVLDFLVDFIYFFISYITRLFASSCACIPTASVCQRGK